MKQTTLSDAELGNKIDELKTLIYELINSKMTLKFYGRVGFAIIELIDKNIVIADAETKKTIIITIHNAE